MIKKLMHAIGFDMPNSSDDEKDKVPKRVGILPQVKADAQYLNEYILSLTSDYPITIGGRFVTGEQKEAILEPTRLKMLAQLKELELILETGIIPNKYKTIKTKETYYPSPEELIKKSEPLPTAEYTMFGVKDSRKEKAEAKNSHFKIIRSDTSPLTDFFMEHREDKGYPKGGFAAKVKKGYVTEECSDPKYAIKVYNKNIFSGDTIHELRVAMRASYCYNQLGREGFAFRRNNKQYMVTEWLRGATLDSAKQDDIKSMAIPRRIVMAISLLIELSILHKQGLIHNDIKPSNVMINYGKLNFVDLDSVRPKNEIPLYGTVPMFTRSYLPNPQMSFDTIYNPTGLYLKFNEATDRHAMGITLIHLFPEIYIPEPVVQKIKVTGGPIAVYSFETFSFSHGEKYVEHPNLQKLLKQMIFPQDPTIETIDQYIEAFQTVLKTYPDHQQYLEEIKYIRLGSEISPTDGEKAFKEIEIELLGYNQRLGSFLAILQKPEEERKNPISELKDAQSNPPKLEQKPHVLNQKPSSLKEQEGLENQKILTNDAKKIEQYNLSFFGFQKDENNSFFTQRRKYIKNRFFWKNNPLTLQKDNIFADLYAFALEHQELSPKEMIEQWVAEYQRQFNTNPIKILNNNRSSIKRAITSSTDLLLQYVEQYNKQNNIQDDYPECLDQWVRPN